MKVFIIEDNIAFQDQLKLFLNKIGEFEIHGFETVASSVNKFSMRPEILLVDHCLPRIEGSTAVKFYREAFPESLIIVISGQHKVTVVADAIRSGADYYVEKNEMVFEKLEDMITKYVKSKEKSFMRKLKDSFSKT